MLEVSKVTSTNYYKCYLKRGEWCIISFDYSNPVVADSIVRSFVRCGVVWKRISEEVFFNHTLKYFASFRLGALRFDVGSRDCVSYIRFFYSRLVGSYDSSYQILEPVRPGIVLPVSKT